MYTNTVNYIPVPEIFLSGVICFEPRPKAIKRVQPDSSVYDRATKVFDQSVYKNPVAPLDLGYRFIDPEPGYVLRLLVKAPGTPVLLPERLGWILPLLRESLDYQAAHFPDFENRFVYVTVRSGEVKSTRDTDFHVDGFQGVSTPRHIPEQSYIWTNKSPTVFAVQPFYIEQLDPAIHNAHMHFDAKVDRANVIQGRCGHMYIIDPYHVHARPHVTEGTERAMVRITYSPVEICDDTNTENPHLRRGPYRRRDIRNSLIGYEGDPR